MTRTQKLLAELIALPSVNPAFLPAGHPRSGEHRVVDFLTATAAKAGLDVDQQQVFPQRCNLIAQLSPTGEVRQRILLAPHLDTVDVASEDQLVPAIKNGRLYGRGACDTKGSAAAMLTAIFELAEGKVRPAHTEINFLGLIDEEAGQGGSHAFAEKGFKADLAIVGEPTLLQLVTAHKGNLWLKLETHGKAAHGSCPELGKNAVHAMARIVDLLETKYAAQLRKRKHPLLGNATINVGTIQGGVQANIVPSYCSITLDRRTLPGETDASVWREIQALLKQHNLMATLGNTKASPCLPMETSSKLPLVQQFLRVLGQRKPQGVDYFCDASVLAHGGIPSIVFGPGDIAQAHTADEWISLQSLERGKDLMVKFLKSLP
ncbi:M20 family metallopeptidase [Pedosphaera parvula]|uniref:Peptidase dimerisation domain protein n=1 Tax=Pedosphaera parvula (strain Ellin514) TaxID=320771 RepID=B9XMC2_PEDPL|nr:M20/M25/M40 family metallo-hydrolase [Pedosphaera parvula]EEF58964.1 peptidase dimerisation domain protein [Pedosphaera parvula Ellin514]